MADAAVDRPSSPCRLIARAVSALLYIYPIFVASDRVGADRPFRHDLSAAVAAAGENRRTSCGGSRYSGDLLFHGSITLQRALTGFVAAIVVGICDRHRAGARSPRQPADRADLRIRLSDPEDLALSGVHLRSSASATCRRSSWSSWSVSIRSRFRPCPACAAPNGSWSGRRKTPGPRAAGCSGTCWCRRRRPRSSPAFESRCRCRSSSRSSPN